MEMGENSADVWERFQHLQEVVHGQAAQNAQLTLELQKLKDRITELECGVQISKDITQPHGQAVQPASSELAPPKEGVGTASALCLEAGTWNPAAGVTKKLTTKTVIDTQTHHALQESFWDALLLAGLDEIGPAGTVMIIVGVAVSFCLQLLFCWIVCTSFLSADAKYDLTYLKEWRVLYGHSVNFYDSVSGASLVSKVCQGRPFEREWWNNALLSEINAYLMPVIPGGSESGFTVGVVLSGMALTIWACHIAAELQNVGSFASSIYRLPRGTTHVTPCGEDDRVFESISFCRLTMLSFVVIGRFSIAVMLGISGGLWLALTRDVTNIMLNAVALLFILEIDDLLYKVLAPKHAMKYLSSIREFEVGHRKTWAGVDMSSVLKFTALLTAVAIFIRCTVWENALQAKAARELLCGGNQDFVYGSHPTLGPVFVTDTLSFDQRAENMLPGMRPLVDDVVFNYDPRDMKDYMWRRHLEDRGKVAVKHLPSAGEMQNWLQMSDTQAPEETAFGSRSYGTFCRDMNPAHDWWEAEWLWPTLEALTGARSCADVKPFCERKDLPLVRMVCPQTCGCTRADSGLYTDNGCRQACQEETAFRASLNRSVCHDFRADEAHRRELWSHWWSGFYNNSVGTWKDDNEMMKFARDGAQGNCSFFSSADWIPGIACKHSAGISRPATLLCPETCGCTGAAPDGFWCTNNCPTSKA